MKKQTEFDGKFFEELMNLAKEIWIVQDADEYYVDAVHKIAEFDARYNTPYSLHFSEALTKTINDFSVLAGHEAGARYGDVRGMS